MDERERAITSSRLVFAGGGRDCWPWREVRGLFRAVGDLFLFTAPGFESSVLKGAPGKLSCQGWGPKRFRGVQMLGSEHIALSALRGTRSRARPVERSFLRQRKVVSSDLLDGGLPRSILARHHHVRL